jgi:LysM repeat protein
MQITHAKALRLIQYQADGAVVGENEKELHRHLADCAECRAYAEEFHEMENVLQSVMRKQWTLRPAPLSLARLTATSTEWKNKRALLITRISLISFAFLASVFIGWQLALTSTSMLITSQPVLPPVPTPSTLFTATIHSSANCSEALYTVQTGDTLETIAQQFSTTKETIMEWNQLKTESINPNMEMRIRICDSTPTSTTHPPTSTITPILEPITYTPG